jgi:hypothetical protein
MEDKEWNHPNQLSIFMDKCGEQVSISGKNEQIFSLNTFQIT